MTEKLYFTDSYQKECDSIVTEVKGNKIALDQTVFYPVGGGQPSDKGIVEVNGDEYKVEHVKKEDGEIFHQLEEDHDLKEDDEVHCRIDWDRRYRFMRMHTALHVLSSIVNEEFDGLGTGNKIGYEKSRIDFDVEELDSDIAEQLIEKTSEVCKEGHEVSIEFMDREEAMEIPEVVKLAEALPPNIDTLRLVEIGDVDLQADGGTHVKNTKEVGELEFLDFTSKGKNNKRIYFTLKD